MKKNDRNRPYNGQLHTDFGEREKTLVKGLTMRDISDCIAQGFLAASHDSSLQDKTSAMCPEEKWYHKNNWEYNDLYKIKMDIDPMAVIQNALCYIEAYMGIFPNIGKSKRVNKEVGARKSKYIPWNTSTSPLKCGDVIINKYTGNKITVAKVSKKYCLVDTEEGVAFDYGDLLYDGWYFKGTPCGKEDK